MKNIFPYTLMRIGGISFEKLDALCINALLFEEIYESIETAQNSSELENQFNEELIRIREMIKTLSKESALRNGLVLSAPSVLDRIVSYQKKEIARFRKKEKQTERTIVQYLTRIATKTSPFSTFNQIGLAEIKEQPSLIENAELTSNQSFVRINNYILKSFKDSVVQDRTLVQGLRIVVNSTLTRLENGYEFLVNDNNIEAFQTIGEHPVVGLILEKLEGKQTVYFRDLIKKLLEEVDAEIEDLENFVLELHSIGLLEFEINVSNLDSNWELKCLDLLDNLPKCQLSEDWTTLLLQLQEAKQKYPLLTFRERIILLKKVFVRFNGLFERIQKGIEKREQTVFKKQFDNHLTFNEMNLLYEDYAVKSSTSLSKQKIEALLIKINAFLKALQPFQRNEEMERLTVFYKKHYNNRTVDLLTFYKTFSAWKLSNNSDDDLKNDVNEGFQEWKSAFKKTIVIKDDIVNVEIDELQTEVLNSKEKQLTKSHSAFVQLYKNGNEFQCFLNSVMPGYGKYFSRFLHLFPNVIRKELQKENENEEQIFAEINDNSFFNANIHPPLMPFEIKLLDENVQLDETKQILLKEIKVVLEEKELKLIHQQTKKEIIPFDVGFQALSGRSELFKLLSAFSEANYSPVHQVINVVNDLVVNQNKIRIFPRITIENQIVIQRKTWIISKNTIPKAQQKHETEWMLYRRVVNWLKENNFPLEGFYTINPKELAKDKLQIRNTDAYKPQYVNFKNPILVQLFIRGCKKTETSLKLEEMLPSSKHLLKWNKEKYVSEFLLQWKG